jgi:hypothetical protein
VSAAVLIGLCLLFALAWTAAWPLLGELDTPGGDMGLRASLRDAVRHYLGTAHIDTIPDHLHRMENTMSEITEALNRLAQQVNGVSAAQATSFHNLQVAIDELRAGKLSAEQAEIVDRIEKSLTKLGEDAAAGDDGFEPTPAPETPGGETPAGPVDTPELPGDVPVDSPVVEPGTDTPAEQTDDNARRR